MIPPQEAGGIQVDRATLRYEIFGAGPLVIVLHGGPGIGYQYLLPELADSLSNCAQLIFYDQRASGQSTGSSTPELLNASTFVGDLVQVYKSLSISQAILLGHSFGGLLAMQFSLGYPDLVTGLILVDSDPASKALWSCYPQRLRPQKQEDLAELEQIRSSARWQTDPSRISRYFELLLKPFFFSEDKIPSGFGHRFASTKPENLFGTGPLVRASLGDWDLYPQLKDLRIPTLIVVGNKSIYPEEAVIKLRESLPISELMKVAESSHFPQIESAEAFGHAVAGFIQRLNRARRRYR
jgi:proline iminopeptidase